MTTDADSLVEDSGAPHTLIDVIKQKIAKAKSAIANGIGADELDGMLDDIYQTIMSIVHLGNPQCTSPLMQSYLSLIETKPNVGVTVDADAVVVMVKRLGYTPEFIQIYAKLLSPDALDNVVRMIAVDPLLVVDNKSARMAVRIAQYNCPASTLDLLDKMLGQRVKMSGPILLQALNELLQHENLGSGEFTKLFLDHQETLKAIPDVKASTAGAAGVGFMRVMGVIHLHHEGHVALAAEVAKTMCRPPYEPNHYLQLASIGLAPDNAYFEDRLVKYIHVDDIFYAIQNPELTLPIERIRESQGMGKNAMRLINGLSKLTLPQVECENRLLAVLEALVDGHPVNRNYALRSGLPGELLCRINSLRDSVFSADLGL